MRGSYTATSTRPACPTTSSVELLQRLRRQDVSLVVIFNERWVTRKAGKSGKGLIEKEAPELPDPPVQVGDGVADSPGRRMIAQHLSRRLEGQARGEQAMHEEMIHARGHPARRSGRCWRAAADPAAAGSRHGRAGPAAASAGAAAPPARSPQTAGADRGWNLARASVTAAPRCCPSSSRRLEISMSNQRAVSGLWQGTSIVRGPGRSPSSAWRIPAATSSATGSWPAAAHASR